MEDELEIKGELKMEAVNVVSVVVSEVKMAAFVHNNSRQAQTYF